MVVSDPGLAVLATRSLHASVAAAEGGDRSAATASNVGGVPADGSTGIDRPGVQAAMAPRMSREGTSCGRRWECGDVPATGAATGGGAAAICPGQARFGAIASKEAVPVSAQ